MVEKIEIKAAKAEYPQRSCRDHVWGQFQGFNCELPDVHEGPCVSWSVHASLERRFWWEDAQAKAVAGEEAP